MSVVEVKGIKGIDVSRYQGDIIWSDVKKDGVEFAIIRAGFGKSNIDEYFFSNINGCIENNVKIGVYWFLYCINEEEAIQNADMFHSVIATYKDYITMKVWCDFEYDTEKNANRRGVYFTKETRTSIVRAFCERLKGYGYDVGNYANHDYLKNKFNDLSEYPLWLARYSSSKGDYDCYMWQYSSKGSVAGIVGNVDMNVYYAKVKDETEIVIEPINIIKGEPEQFYQIIKNIKLALNTDFGLQFVIDSAIDDVLLINLANANMSVLAYTENLTYALTQLLSWWGYPLEIKEIYDNTVCKTIRLFQEQTGSSATGTTTFETWRKLLGK